MTVTQEDRGRLNMYAQEPRMYISKEDQAKFALETYAERAEKTNGRWAMMGFVSLLISYATTGNLYFGVY